MGQMRHSLSGNQCFGQHRFATFGLFFLNTGPFGYPRRLTLLEPLQCHRLITSLNTATPVLANVFDATDDSLFPLQGALGYEIQQTLFIGPNSLVVEGVADMLYLRAVSGELEREGRTELAQACFDFLPTRAALDLAGWPEVDIFAHS